LLEQAELGAPGRGIEGVVMSGRPTTSLTESASNAAVRGGGRNAGAAGVGAGLGQGLPVAEFPELRDVPVSDLEARAIRKSPVLWKKFIKGGLPSAEHGRLETSMSEALASEPLLHPDLAGMESPYFDYLRDDRRDAADFPVDDAAVILARVYDRLCRHEYSQVRGDLKPAFEDMAKNFDIEPAWRYYRSLRPAYVKAGFPSPPTGINQVAANAEFLGKKVWLGAHPDLLKCLRKAEEYLEQRHLRDQVEQSISAKHFGGFVPRLIAGTSTLSNHGLGRAIDIDAPSNPMLTGSSARAIDDLLDFLQTKGRRCHGRIRQLFRGYDSISLEAHDRMQEISKVVVGFLNEWIPKWEKLPESIRALDEETERIRAVEEMSRTMSVSPDEIAAQQSDRDALLHALEEHRRAEKYFSHLRNLIVAWGGIRGGIGLKQAKYFQRHGLITIPLEVFQALRESGATSGLEWKHSKDTMHFEV
jgi:hypothetical protein